MISLVAALLVASVPTSSSAPAAPATVHASPHTEKSSVIFGLELAHVSVFHSQLADPNGQVRGATGRFGPRFRFEATAIEGWLEVSVSVGAHDFDKGWMVPFVILFEKPFHLSDVVQLYVGLGPEFRLWTDLESAPGFALAAGGYVWPWPDVGLHAEVLGSVISQEGAEGQLTLTLGPAVRF